MTIRPAAPADIPAIVRLTLAMALESEHVQLEVDILQAGVQAVFEHPARGRYWVLESPENKALIGCTLITPEWSDWHNASYWWLQSVYLHPDYRGRGLFEQLLETLTQAAHTANVRELRLYVERQNRRAIRVYERTGFRADHYACMTRPITRPDAC